jgi:hypothetical protein
MRGGAGSSLQTKTSVLSRQSRLPIFQFAHNVWVSFRIPEVTTMNSTHVHNLPPTHNRHFFMRTPMFYPFSPWVPAQAQARAVGACAGCVFACGVSPEDGQMQESVRQNNHKRISRQLKMNDPSSVTFEKEKKKQQKMRVRNDAYVEDGNEADDEEEMLLLEDLDGFLDTLDEDLFPMTLRQPSTKTKLHIFSSPTPRACKAPRHPDVSPLRHKATACHNTV